MRILYTLLVIIVAVILDRIFGVAIWQLIKPIIDSLPYQWWIVILLFGVVIFLLLLIDGARRYHKRIVGELGLCANNIKTLATAYGRLCQFDDMLGRDNLEPFPKAVFINLDHEVRRYLQEYFRNSQVVKDYCADLPRIDLPDSLDTPSKQQEWVNAFMHKLEKLLAERRDELSTALKITEGE